MALDRDVVEVSLKNLRREGIRTFLTLIGVVIGIAAIVSLLSIGQGLNVAVTEQFESLGSNTIFIFPGSSQQSYVRVSIEPSDVSMMESISGVEKVVALYAKSSVFEYNGQKVNVTVNAIDAEDAAIFEDTGFLDVMEGRQLTKGDSDGMVIGYSIAYDLFDRELHTRKIVSLDGTPYQVIGILKKQNQSIGGGGPESGGVVYMSLEAYRRMDPSKEPVPAGFFVKTLTKDDTQKAADEIKENLEKKYGEGSFMVNTSAQILEQINQFLSLITIFLVGVGGISLIVGGIGIMNAMITSVMERTKEIGVMKALGASSNKILAIFLLESAFIGAIGGIIGTVIGLGLANIIAIVGQASGFALVAYFGPEIPIGAIIFSMLVGMASGFIPARRAAGLDPVSALRYE